MFKERQDPLTHRRRPRRPSPQIGFLCLDQAALVEQTSEHPLTEIAPAHLTPLAYLAYGSLAGSRRVWHVDRPRREQPHLRTTPGHHRTRTSVQDPRRSHAFLTGRPTLDRVRYRIAFTRVSGAKIGSTQHRFREQQANVARPGCSLASQSLVQSPTERNADLHALIGR